MSKVANILFPADYFDKSRPDPAMQAEYEAALAEARLDVDTFDLERFECDGRVVLGRGFSDPSLPLVYRGWMMKPGQYVAFHRGLRELGLSPLVGAGEYAEFHMFPIAYERHAVLREISPRLVAFPGTNVDAGAVNWSFSRFMVKDYVKSVKGTSFPAFFEVPVSQGRMDEIVGEFVSLRGELFTEGIAIKEHLDLARRGGTTNEWRAFYLRGKLLSACPNSGQGARSAPAAPPEAMLRAVEDLGSPFCTVDFAELSGGGWIVVETGDGQVSGLATSQGPEVFYGLLADALGREA